MNGGVFLGAISLKAQTYRGEQLMVGFDPEKDNPCHGQVWGNRTKIDGVRVRCSTVELSPTRSPQKDLIRKILGCRGAISEGFMAALPGHLSNHVPRTAA
jgi:hypothetical protein